MPAIPEAQILVDLTGEPCNPTPLPQSPAALQSAQPLSQCSWIKGLPRAVMQKKLTPFWNKHQTLGRTAFPSGPSWSLLEKQMLQSRRPSLRDVLFLASSPCGCSLPGTQRSPHALAARPDGPELRSSLEGKHPVLAAGLLGEGPSRKENHCCGC